MSNIATLDSVSNALDTHSKWLRVMQKAGVTHEQFILPMNDKAARRNLAAYLAAGCPKFPSIGTVARTAPAACTLPAAFQEAQEILGDDFISPQDVMKNRDGTLYTEAQLAEFETTLPSKEELVWLQRNGFMLVPGPQVPLSTLDLREINSKYFYTKTGGWYADVSQVFSRNDRVTTKWLKLRKGEVPGSPGQNWNEQQGLISGIEYVPNAAEVIWGITTYKAVHNVHLLRGVYVRTSSRGLDGGRVYVGQFDHNGLSVDNGWDNDRGGLGMASARK